MKLHIYSLHLISSGLLANFSHGPIKRLFTLAPLHRQCNLNTVSLIFCWFFLHPGLISCLHKWQSWIECNDIDNVCIICMCWAIDNIHNLSQRFIVFDKPAVLNGISKENRYGSISHGNLLNVPEIASMVWTGDTQLFNRTKINKSGEKTLHNSLSSRLIQNYE